MKIPDLQLPGYPIVKKKAPKNRVAFDLVAWEWKVIIDNITYDRCKDKSQAETRLDELLKCKRAT